MLKSSSIVRLLVFLTVVLAASCGSHESHEATPGSAGGQARAGERPEPATLKTNITQQALAADVKYLASDELQGRAPGSRGEELTLAYLAEQYSSIGLRPGNPDGTYTQAVPLISATVTNSPSLHVRSESGRVELHYLDEFMGWTLRQTERATIDDADLLFVGYGIDAPEYGWNDYKDVDVRGKIIVMLVGDPPLPDTTMFGGKAMTYYGRWTYKFEVAAKKGAAGAIVIHNTESAGYPWAVVSNSWSGEQFDIVRTNAGADRCALEGWITDTAAEGLLGRGGIELQNAYRVALSKDFRPVPLRMTASIAIQTRFRHIESHNVVAAFEGNDAKLRNEYIIYAAHWDHLGIGNPVDGDSIYNGALDNASGVAATLAIARAFAPHRHELKRSVLFLNTTAEESGLLGSKYYAQHPLYALTRTIAVINIDGLNVWGRTSDVVVVGFGYSDLDGYLRRACEVNGRDLKPDPEPEKGYYYRSDHFPFAKKGVPALYADSGIDYVDHPGNWGSEMKQGYTSERYHKPQDEYDASWDFSGAIEDLEAFFRVGMALATSADTPQWREKSEFKAIRDAAMRANR